MRKKREICEWETERYKYRKYLIFFDLSTMVPADFHAGLREKEEEYRKLQEKERSIQYRLHEFTEYFDPVAQHFVHTYLKNPLFRRFMEFLWVKEHSDIEVCLMTSLGLSEDDLHSLMECFRKNRSLSDLGENKITRLIDYRTRDEAVEAVRSIVEQKDQLSLENTARAMKEDPDFEYSYTPRPGFVIISRNSYNAEFENHSCVYSDEPALVADQYLHRASHMLFRHSSILDSVHGSRDNIGYSAFRNRKIIFLDIDGVLNHDGYDEHGRIEQINENMVKQLAYIVRKTGAEIVLSSSWRCLISNFVADSAPDDQGLKDLIRYFRQENLVISDLTPEAGRLGEFSRPLEIRRWLDQNHDIDNFVILDDECFWLWGFLKFHVVTTTTPAVTPEEKELMKITTPYSRDKIYGLTREHAERAIEILMREAPYCDRNNRD